MGQATTERRQAGAVADQEQHLLNGVRVLIADGNATSRSILRRQLRGWGCRVNEAVDVGEALALLRFASAIKPFGIVLIDERLSGGADRVIEAISGEPQLAGIPLARVQTRTARGFPAATISATSPAIITKPIRQDSLYHLLIRLLNRQPVPEMPDDTALGESDSTSDLNRPRILLAEDNAINQKVATGMLNGLGYRADVVSDGCDALAVLEWFTYDLVLMDVEMPKMGGYPATVAIREREKRQGGHLPVIAMTAHALSGDRERCLSAGMDDYISKPIRQQRLAEVLQRWCPGGRGPRPAAKPAPVSTEEAAPVFRYERLREIVGTNLTLERELLRDFLDDSNRRIADLRSALLDRSASRVAAEAHSLMGACRTLGADSLAGYCGELEQAADHLPVESVIGVLAGLRRENDRLRATIGIFLNSKGDPEVSPTGQSRDMPP